MSDLAGVDVIDVGSREMPVPTDGRDSQVVRAPDPHGSGWMSFTASPAQRRSPARLRARWPGVGEQPPPEGYTNVFRKRIVVRRRDSLAGDVP